jgi:hypothetical protein
LLGGYQELQRTLKIDRAVTKFYDDFNEAVMANPAGDSDDGVLRLDFDRRLKLQFCGSEPL